MVQVAAQHFGFEVLEINASDVRTASQLLSLIQGVQTSGDCYYRQRDSSSTNSSRNKKPVLLLLDEIDSLAQQGPAAAPAEGDTEGGDTSGRRQGLVEGLLRIIQQNENSAKPLLKR